MDVGKGRGYGVQCVDGVVGIEGGEKLKEEIGRLKRPSVLRRFLAPLERLIGRESTDPVVLSTGNAIATGSHGLSDKFSRLIHVAPPFYSDIDSDISLLRCYSSAFEEAKRGGKEGGILTPLVGAGVRGFPVEEAVSIFLRAVVKAEIDVAVCVVDEEVANEMVDQMEEMIKVE